MQKLLALLEQIRASVENVEKITPSDHVRHALQMLKVEVDSAIDTAVKIKPAKAVKK